MSYDKAMKAARKYVSKAGHYSLAEMVSDIICHQEDDFFIALSECAEITNNSERETMRQVAIEEAGKLVIGALHNHLAEHYSKEWLDLEDEESTGKSEADEKFDEDAKERTADMNAERRKYE